MKKIISLILCLSMIFVPFNFVGADENTEKGPYIEIADMKVNSGDEITVPVVITGNTHGVITLSTDITYDSSLLTYTGYEQNIYQGIVVVNANQPGTIIQRGMATSNYNGDGALITYKFKVNETDKKDIKTEINLVVSELYYLTETYEVLPYDNRVTKSGAITINSTGENNSSSTTTEASTEATTVTTKETSTETTTITTAATTKETSTETTTAAKETSSETTTAKAPEVTTAKTTEAPSEATTVKAPETTTETPTETTTIRHTSSGGGGGGGGSSKSAAKANSAKETNSTNSTEVTTKEAVSEATTSSIISNDVKLTIGNKNVTIGNKTYQMDAAPYIQAGSNSTLVPLRFASLAIVGGDITNADTNKMIGWDAAKKTATVTVNGKTISFTAGSLYMTIDGKSQLMENGVKAEIKDSRIYIPFRALGTALGVNVSWEAETKTAIYKAK